MKLRRVRWSQAVAFTAASSIFLMLSAGAQAELALKDEPHPSNIQLVDTDEGAVFADSKGLTLYYGLDAKPGISTCTNDAKYRSVSNFGDEYGLPNQDNRPTCVSKHPPAQVGDAKPVGPWTVIDRPDGIKQWAYHGKPVYTSIKDYYSGEVNGAGGARGNNNLARSVAFAPVMLPPEVRIEAIGIARVLSSYDGMTLYTSSRDPLGKSACEDKCAEIWHPLLAPSLAVAKGSWTLVTRADKTRQWALNGKPLYTYIGDQEGETKGEHIATWSVALAHALPPPPPRGISTHATATGVKFSTSEGMTLYVWNCNEFVGQGTGIPLACDDPQNKSNWWTTTCGSEAKCADTWRPLIADKDAKPVGHSWSVVTLPQTWQPVRALDDSQPGIKVWAYRGRPVFTYKYDDHPGMIDGDDIGVFGTLRWTSISAVGSDIGRSNQVVETQPKKYAGLSH